MKMACNPKKAEASLLHLRQQMCSLRCIDTGDFLCDKKGRALVHMAMVLRRFDTFPVVVASTLRMRQLMSSPGFKLTLITALPEILNALFGIWLAHHRYTSPMFSDVRSVHCRAIPSFLIPSSVCWDNCT
jgi:hypothetical protein